MIKYLKPIYMNVKSYFVGKEQRKISVKSAEFAYSVLSVKILHNYASRIIHKAVDLEIDTSHLKVPDVCR